MRHPLCGEALELFDGVMGGVQEELADQVQALVVGDVSGRFLVARFPVQVLARPSAPIHMAEDEEEEEEKHT